MEIMPKMRHSSFRNISVYGRDLVKTFCVRRLDTTVSRVRRTFAAAANRFREDSVIAIYANPTVRLRSSWRAVDTSGTIY